jgi:hypothetical protein
VHLTWVLFHCRGWLQSTVPRGCTYDHFPHHYGRRIAGIWKRDLLCVHSSAPARPIHPSPIGSQKLALRQPLEPQQLHNPATLQSPPQHSTNLCMAPYTNPKTPLHHNPDCTALRNSLQPYSSPQPSETAGATVLHQPVVWACKAKE